MALRSIYPLPPARPVQPTPPALAQRRAAIAATPPAYSVDPRADIVGGAYGGARCLTISPPGWRGCMLYFHGGGYRLGSPERSSGFLSHLALRTGCRIVAPAYRLAPENPFPAALHDGAAALEALAAMDAPLILAGDSAGGGAAAALGAAFGQALAGRLRAAVLFSPWTDLTVTAPSFASRATTDQLFGRAAAAEAAEAYLQGASPSDPLASPNFADLSGMPPTLIIAGTAETLLNDSLTLAARLAQHDIDVDLRAVAHMQHVSPLLFPEHPTTEPCLSAVDAHIARHLA